MLAAPNQSSSQIAPVKKTTRKLQHAGRWNELEEADTQAGSSTSSMNSSANSNASFELESRSLDGDSDGSTRGDRRRERRENVESTKGKGTPLEAPTKMSQLRSSASLFVPGQCPAPPPPVAAIGKQPVRCIIEGVAGNRLCGLRMVDTPSHFEVEVTLHPSQDDYESWNMDPQMEALNLLLRAFSQSGQFMSAQPSADQTQINVRYSEIASNRLCWEYAQYGCCPRGPSCRWEHGKIEDYMISVVIQPTGMDYTAGMDFNMPPLVPSVMPCADMANQCGGYIIAAPVPAPIEDVCSSCGTKFLPLGKFCQTCGAKRPQPQEQQVAGCQGCPGMYYPIAAVPVGDVSPTSEAVVADAPRAAPRADPAETFASAQDALAIARAAGDYQGVADSVRTIIQCFVDQGKADEAKALGSEELKAFKEAGRKDEEAKLLLSMSQIIGKQPEFAGEALGYAKEALAIFRQSAPMKEREQGRECSSRVVDASVDAGSSHDSEEDRGSRHREIDSESSGQTTAASRSDAERSSDNLPHTQFLRTTSDRLCWADVEDEGDDIDDIAEEMWERRRQASASDKDA